jgi:CoA-transferase family III
VLARVCRLRADRPLAERPGFASVAEAVGRPATSTATRARRPRAPASRSVTRSAGMFAVMGILAALYHRDARGGRSKVVDIALSVASLALTESAIPEFDRTGKVRQPVGRTSRWYSAVEHLSLTRQAVDGDRRQSRRALPAALRRHGPPRAGDGSAVRYARLPWRRSARTRRDCGGVGCRAATPTRSTGSSTRQGSCAAPSTRWPTSS